MLKNDRYISVREKVAHSVKISPKIIERLARDSVPLIRKAIALNQLQVSTQIGILLICKATWFYFEQMLTIDIL